MERERPEKKDQQNEVLKERGKGGKKEIMERKRAKQSGMGKEKKEGRRGRKVKR